ncbi:hypothetical protein DFR49_2280 [Hephaestia caeni]|uniref:Tail protein n=1 Tax=Hephaestia caeni TaxID=645617 RepID=A0A397PD05_9SPHN|nr:hypothetical protein [Hephaestia caeni]RIA44044.1 hypothetical protein DFR49_2280 [Hephaestia caeni]
MAIAPIKWRSKIIAAKIETTYATDAAPTGAADAMLLTDVQLQPMEGDDVERNVERAFMGANERFPSALRAVLTGSIELVGGGASNAGEPPPWGALLRACGVAEVLTEETEAGAKDGKVEYSPVSDDHESVSIYFFIGNTKHVLLGARGTAVATVTAQGLPSARVTLTGLWTQPAEGVRIVPDLSKFQKPQVASKANTPVFTIGGDPFTLRELTFNLGCDVQPRLLIGTEAILIVDKAEQLSARVDAVPLTTYNPFALANTQTAKAVVLEHGTIAGRKVKLEFPTAVQQRLTGYEQNQNILEWPLQFVPTPDEGDDQWLITLT